MVSISPPISFYQGLAFQPSICSVMLTTPFRKPSYFFCCNCQKGTVAYFLQKGSRKIPQKLGDSAVYTGFLGSGPVSPPVDGVVHLFYAPPETCRELSGFPPHQQNFSGKPALGLWFGEYFPFLSIHLHLCFLHFLPILKYQGDLGAFLQGKLQTE